MRMTYFLVPLAGAALTLSACSGERDAASEANAQNAEAATAGATAAAQKIAVLDANSASAEQLAAADGMTAELATAIIAGRPYASVVDLNKKLLETLAPDAAAKVLVGVFVPVNLNKGTEEEIRLIPGMSDKMVHEFEEYRPYADMGVFDREIGKYVDAAEVARFRNYVTL